MNVEQKVNIHNRFDIHIDNIETGEHREVKTYNIILDQMWSRILETRVFFSHIHFGGGSGVPTANRTRLFTHISTRATTDVEIIKSFPTSNRKRKIVLNPEEFVGSTITEVGIAYDGGTDSLVTHSMLKDAEGNPISIVKTATDVITIFATIFITLQPLSNGLRYNGLPNNNLIINYLTGSGGLIGYFTYKEFAAAATALGSVYANGYADLPNKKYKTNLVRAGTTVGNGHIQHIVIPGLFEVDLPTAAFPGQSVIGAAVGIGDGVKKTFLLPSRNVRPGSLVIKINGVVNTDNVNELIQTLNDGFLNTDTRTYSKSCDVSRDGSVAITVSMYGDDKSALITRDVSGEYFNTQIQCIGPRSIKMAKNGSRFAMTCSSYHVPAVYNIIGKTIVKLPDPVDYISAYMDCVAISDNGEVIAVANGNTTNNIEIYDIVANVLVRRPNPSGMPVAGIKGIDLTDSGSKLFVAYGSKVIIYIWNGVVWTEGPIINQINIEKLATRSDGLMFILGLNASPYAVAYEFITGTWTKITLPTLAAPLDSTLDSLSINDSGSLIVYGINAAPFIQLFRSVSGVYELVPNFSSPESVDAVRLAGEAELLSISYSRYKPSLIDIKKRGTQVTFTNPPAVGEVITSDYIVDGIHKTDQFVLDSSVSIQFGEGV